ncbi:MAG: protein translocase subunit SecF, partial [Elusimicrobiota bacterium]
FVGLRWYCYAFSLVLAIGTMTLLIIKGGPPLGIDFKGGIVMQFKVPATVDISTLRNAFVARELDSNVQNLGEPGMYLARFSQEQEHNDFDGRFMAALASVSGEGAHEILSKGFVGAVVGEKLRSEALLAFGLSFLGIIVYVGFRFSNLIWGVAGVIALMHDVWITIGFVTLCNYEIDLVMVAALLTIAGYSINDTVVIFDRMRERLRLYPREDFRTTINRSFNDTLSRTVITSGATMLAVLALALLGGLTLRPFALALMVGMISGTYSTLGIASGLVFNWAGLAGNRR